MRIEENTNGFLAATIPTHSYIKRLRETTTNQAQNIEPKQNEVEKDGTSIQPRSSVLTARSFPTYRHSKIHKNRFRSSEISKIPLCLRSKWLAPPTILLNSKRTQQCIIYPNGVCTRFRIGFLRNRKKKHIEQRQMELSWYSTRSEG